MFPTLCKATLLLHAHHITTERVAQLPTKRAVFRLYFSESASCQCEISTTTVTQCVSRLFTINIHYQGLFSLLFRAVSVRSPLFEN